jgi:hypothetical protein
MVTVGSKSCGRSASATLCKQFAREGKTTEAEKHARRLMRLAALLLSVDAIGWCGGDGGQRKLSGWDNEYVAPEGGVREHECVG